MLYGIGRRRMMERPHFDIVASGARMRAIRQERKISVSGITFSGGDPMHPVNRADVR